MTGLVDSLQLRATSRTVGAWTGPELLARDDWKVRVPVDAARTMRGVDPNGIGIASPPVAAFAAELFERLTTGDGVVCLKGLVEALPDPIDRRAFHVAIAESFGEVLTQYGRLFEIRDRGVDYTKDSIPVSMTSAPTGFHTDSSRADVVPDFVGLLCERPSASGGDSLVANALNVHRELAASHPGVLAVLERAFIRDVVTPGVEKTRDALLRNRFPVFQRVGDRPEGVLFRYMRFWIERGQTVAGRPIDAEERAAFDVLDRLLAEPRHHVRFRLDAGDAMWVNNRFLAHDRTGYDDAGGPGRLLFRTWVRRNDLPQAV